VSLSGIKSGSAEIATDFITLHPGLLRELLQCPVMGTSKNSDFVIPAKAGIQYFQ